MSVAREIAKAAKAVVAGAIALCGGMAIAASDGHLTQTEVWTVAGSVVTALGAVYGVANAVARSSGNDDAEGRHARSRPKPGD